MCKKHTQKLFLILADVPFKIDRLKKKWSQKWISYNVHEQWTCAFCRLVIACFHWEIFPMQLGFLHCKMNYQWSKERANDWTCNCMFVLLKVMFSYSEANWWPPSCWRRSFTKPLRCADCTSQSEWLWLSQSVSTATWWAYGMWRHWCEQNSCSDKECWYWFLGVYLY